MVRERGSLPADLSTCCIHTKLLIQDVSSEQVLEKNAYFYKNGSIESGWLLPLCFTKKTKINKQTNNQKYFRYIWQVSVQVLWGRGLKKETSKQSDQMNSSSYCWNEFVCLHEVIICV